MAVRIRLKRMGKIHAPQYRVVVVDSRKKRDGRVIEEIGIYDAMPNPSVIRIDSDRAQYWLGVGAQPSDQVRRLLVLTGDIAKFNGKKDAVSRVLISEKDKAALAAEAVKAAEAEAEKSKAAASAKKAEEEAQAAAEAAAKAEAEKAEESDEAASEEAASGEDA
ncbi:30S ribosomal protein S16 [Schaalia sp. ZJ405]|uniref:30S ribosomal protein S16 n=1 Tax=unclassified Schaalia TaxID=2691889 RepID=UPI0013ECFB55|nr:MULTISPECIES: 30S ribosomal protein S16 [unclassified Schaalia]QPK81988.1 30S ribosomal protein S16 [Schaalia sp. ZJ405]